MVVLLRRIFMLGAGSVIFAPMFDLDVSPVAVTALLVFGLTWVLLEYREWTGRGEAGPDWDEP